MAQTTSNRSEGSKSNASIDLEKADLQDVFTTLNINPEQGLTSKEAQERLAKYGPNGITEKEQSTFSKILHCFMGPISYMIEAAALVSLFLERWEDFIIIAILLIFNVIIETWQGHKASSALSALKKGLALEATAKRDGKFQNIPADTLVPGDIVKVHLGQITPADLRLTKGEFLSIDQAALTGESLPVTKSIGDEAYSGSVIKQGEMEAVVIATGENTFFGRTAKLVAKAGNSSHAQKAMFQIGNALIISAVILAVIMVGFTLYGAITTNSLSIHWALDTLEFVLVLLVASIPVAMPAVFSITMALGALELSKQKAIVSKLSAIEEMAGVDILCSDKTGTLTKNQLTLGDPVLINAQSKQELFIAACLASATDDRDAIDSAMYNALPDQSVLKVYTLKNYTPFDPVSKRSTALVEKDGKQTYFSKGAEQAIVSLCNLDPTQTQQVKDTIENFAKIGYRTLAVAQSDDGKSWKLLGIISMFDPPRDDSAATIKLANQKGIKVKMVTGDDTAIAIETCRQLGLGTNIIAAAEVFPKDLDPNNVPQDISDKIENADGFARVFPEHKYAIVKTLQKRGHIVAMTGDGVNDAPALKQADCGTAVQGATDAARSAADLILTAPGLSVINTAIDAARQIFARIMSYTIYRVALTMAIMILVVFSAIFLQFRPLTAVMIVIISLLDDVPIMSIAYDNTNIDPKPIHWNMKKLIPQSFVIGIVSVIQSIILLWICYSMYTNQTNGWFGVLSSSQVQTIVFLQIVTGGHFLLFVTRSHSWFFSRPFPASILFWAIISTQVLAILMCGFGWFVDPISWFTIIVIHVYDLIWVFILNIIKLGMDHLLRNVGKSNQVSKTLKMQA